MMWSYYNEQEPSATLVVLVRKKDGSFRLCAYYYCLNKIVIKNKFPIPVIDEMLDELHLAKYFSKLDLSSRHYQMRVSLKDVTNIAFRNHEGHYKFKVMLFGLINAPATFQETMNELFKPYLRKFVLVLLLTFLSTTSHGRNILSIWSKYCLSEKKFNSMQTYQNVLFLRKKSNTLKDLNQSGLVNN